MTADDAGHGMTACDVAVVILTFNEEANIAQVLDSVSGWAREIFVLDSHSTDRTLEIAARYPGVVEQRQFTNFGEQRSHALAVFPIQAEWVLFVDADEWLPDDLKQEIANVVRSEPVDDGFYLNRRFIWMGAWIRRGYYPSWILRLFRKGKGRCEARDVNERILVDGSVGHLRHDLIHEDRKNIGAWIARHSAYAAGEAREQLTRETAGKREGGVRFRGAQAERKRWLRHHVWDRLPPLVRPVLYFGYRYVVRGGFLDGREAFTYHFLQALWFPMLIDIRYLELKRRARPPE